MPTLKFTKMHGLGNDFIVIDGISSPFDPASAPIAAWADRHTGIGFDQLLLVERPTSEQADFRYRIFNADGGEVEQCGNGARCFARFVADKGLSGKQEIRVETARGIIVPKLAEHGLVTETWANRVSGRLKSPSCRLKTQAGKRCNMMSVSTAET